MKHEEYFDITQIEGVTPEIIKEYKRLARRERYLEEIDNKHRTYHYGFEEDIEFLLPLVSTSDDSPYETDRSLHIKLREALEELKTENKSWYDAIIEYFYNSRETSYNKIAKNSGVTKQAIFLRVQNGLDFLRKKLGASKK